MNEQGVVAEYIAKLKPDELLFCNAGEPMSRFQALYLMKKYGRLVGLHKSKLRVHSLKHTTGTLMRKSGSSIEDIADHLGHANINNTRIYEGNTPEEVHMAAQRAFIRVGRRIRAGYAQYTEVIGRSPGFGV